MSLFTLWSLHVTHRFSTREFFIFTREMIEITKNYQIHRLTNRYIPKLRVLRWCAIRTFTGKVG